ncbi:phosphatase PAP2 family protein [Plastoroseomonas hellenica]|uniref:phosphatase PAP2 family protein n=1 Tax=Plastoroseomonas hellenica TaxID=2687306 RepID=UPI001BA6AAFC|nr:phosphatase PAP2 family protein [Plastoroseomonas hellenica]MBR0646091.1 phosphatase PAP2 family protein [Plastoroseomonas hellenica]
MRRRPLLLAALPATTALTLPAADAPASEVIAPRGPVEPGAGAWRSWVIASGSAFRLPPPNADASGDEITQLKALAERRDAAALQRIGYWDTGAPSYRWNQILTEALVRNGTPANLAYRHLSVLHIAIHDAMIAAWDSKHTHGRPPPSALDPGLQTVIPNPPSPSYPAEHAVAAGAAGAVLGTLFPQRSDAFRALAEEAAATRLLAGVAYPSDVAAGLALGRRVAATVIERAAADRSAEPWTGTVPTGPGLWSGTNPALPQAASWRTWVLERPDEFRPPPPSAYDSAERRAELAELRDYRRTPKSNADAGFWEYAVGGLRQYQFWGGQLARLTLEHRLDAHAPRVARAFALTYAALHDTGVACWDAKYAYWTIRPFQLDPELRTVFPSPNHPSYPAAHACYSVAAATMLGHLFPRDTEAMAALATDAAESRIWAGIHYRSDIVVGAELARAVAGKVIDRARADGA